jgi:DNA polymerase-3 subunit delta'
VILGHELQRRRLLDAVARDTLHHALLFEGPRGVGKRRVADHLAMAANCPERAPGQDPCEVCRTCRSIAAGQHPDVIVVEPDPSLASRTIAIEVVREVIRQAQYHRYGARRRFVIVDPAESMLEPAANALLKTLEEPVADTHFVLVSHNAKALLPTIRSRCQRIRFGPVAEAELRAWLGERGIDRADLVARLARGCPGRALALVDGGLAEREEIEEQVLAAIGGPLESVYALSQKLTQGGRQDWAGRAEIVLEIVEDLARDAVVAAAGGDPSAPWAPLFPDGIERVARAVQDARDDLEVYVSGRTVLDALFTAIRRELGASTC